MKSAPIEDNENSLRDGLAQLLDSLENLFAVAHAQTSGTRVSPYPYSFTVDIEIDERRLVATVSGLRCALAPLKLATTAARSDLKSMKRAPTSAQSRPARLAQARLSPREKEVLSLLEDAKSNKDIAKLLFIAVGTVKRHTASIYEKLGVRSRIEAVTVARRLGI